MSYVEKQLYNLKSDFYVFFQYSSVTRLVVVWYKGIYNLNSYSVTVFWNTEAFCSCVFFRYTFSTVSVCDWAICIMKLKQNPLFHRRKGGFSFAQNGLWVWSLPGKKERSYFTSQEPAYFISCIIFHKVGRMLFTKYWIGKFLLETTVLLVTLRTFSCGYIDTEKKMCGKERGIINHSI